MKMPSMPRHIAIAGVVLLLLLLGAWCVWFAGKVGGFADAMGCTDRLVQRFDSPDGAFSAFMFARKCGATAPDTLQMNVQPFGSGLDSQRHPAFLVLDSKAEVSAEWREKRSLTVKLAVVSKTYRSESESAGVQIVYVR